MIVLKRAYEEPSSNDGYRILVDRLWPRGLTKEAVNKNLWLRDIGPSTELRKWFGHDPAKWQEFKKKYIEELKEKQDLVNVIIDQAKETKVTLIYGAKDEKHNEAQVILDYIKNLKKK